MRFSLFLMIAAAAVLAPAANVTNTVLMVDQRGSLNVDGVASVADVATNAVKVQIAEAKAAAAQATARGVENAIGAVVDNIMSNNVVIYRSGFTDSFAALVIMSDSDKLIVAEARWVEITAARIVVEIDYVSSADISAVKPLVYARNTIGGGVGRYDFDELADEAVTTPVYHSGSRTIGGETFSGYYTVTATIANPGGTSSYFLWIKVDADAPSGDGTTLDLPNGITGGVSGSYQFGSHTITFQGGVAVEAAE